MKKNIGSQLALYPMPATVIGSMNGDKPTWTLVAHVGIISYDRVLVSLRALHFINGVIKENKTFSINIVDEGILPQTVYSGSVNGMKTDKSSLFAYETGEAGTPVIKKSPLVMECTVVDEYDFPGFESFVYTISNTYVEEGHLNEAGNVCHLRTRKAYRRAYYVKGFRRTDSGKERGNHNSLCGIV